MERDDVVYVSLLVISISFGQVVRNIRNKDLRKWICTLIGLFFVYLVSGIHIVHPLVCTIISMLILSLGSKRYCHVINFGFLFLYLLFFRTTVYFGIPYPPAHTNLVQMILTLKLTGLGFEKYDSVTDPVLDTANDLVVSESGTKINPHYADIFHYAFCYVGVLTGPYYRYRTYHDWLQLPLSSFAPCVEVTVRKLKYVPLYAGLFLFASHIYPIKYMESQEFFTERSLVYRVWYLTPAFFIFRMRMYTGLTLSECVCTMAGVGAYPLSMVSRSGHGPMKNYDYLSKIVSDSEKAREVKYDFETVRSIDPFWSDFSPTTRAAMKHWNSTVQYWLAYYVHKRLPFRKWRTHVTMAVSAYWHGVYAGYFLCMGSVPLYLPVEDLYVKEFQKGATGFQAKFWNVFLWFFKMQEFGYMATAFLLLRINATLNYWKSIYFIGHFVILFLYIFGVSAAKLKNKWKKRGD